MWTKRTLHEYGILYSILALTFYPPRWVGDNIKRFLRVWCIHTALKHSTRSSNRPQTDRQTYKRPSRYRKSWQSIFLVSSYTVISWKCPPSARAQKYHFCSGFVSANFAPFADGEFFMIFTQGMKSLLLEITRPTLPYLHKQMDAKPNANARDRSNRYFTEPNLYGAVK